jgi:hypothetical protein
MSEIKRALSWVAWEQAGAAVKLAQQIDAMQDGFPDAAKLDGAFPEYGPKGRRVRKDKGKKKRGMSPYNLFLRETILNLKSAQPHKYKDSPKIAFKDAVAMWKDVGPAQRDEYAARIKAMFGDSAGQTIDAAATKKRKSRR